MKLSLKYILLSFFTLMSSFLVAQDEVLIRGQVKDQETMKKLDNVTVTVFKNGTQFDVIETGGSGKYEIRLPLGFTYDIKFSKDAFVQKIVRVDTRNIPEEDRAGGFQLDLPGVLFKYVEGFNTDILKEPVGKIFFSSQENALDFDVPYADKMKEKIAAEFKRLEALNAGKDKMQADFDKLMREGDDRMIAKKYKDAMDKFGDALKIFPQDATAKQKYDAAKKAYDDEQAAAAADAKYNALIKEGDDAIKSKSWDVAKKKFTEAKNMKPNEKLPKEKLYEIDQMMANQEKQAEYDAIIADADKKFSSQDYAICIERYRAASALFPTIAYPKDQIAKAQAALDNMLAEESKKKQLEARYNDLMGLGLKNKNEGKFESAIANYREASNLKPEQAEPKDRIKEIEDLIAQAEKDRMKSEADALANREKEEKEKLFNDLVQQADKLYTAKSWLESKAKYQEALAVKEAAYPHSRIQSIDEILAAEEAKKNNDALAEANRLKEEERKRKEAELKAKMDEEARLAEEARLRRMQEEEAERKRREEELAKNQKTSTFSNQANRDAEDEVEAYYREARALEDSAKYAQMRAVAEANQRFIDSRNQRSDDKIKEQKEAIASTKDGMEAMNNRGSAYIARSTAETERKKQENQDTNNDYQSRAESRIDRSMETTDQQKEAQESIVQNDRNRLALMNELDQKKKEYEHNNKGYETKSGTLRTDAAMKIDKEKLNRVEMAMEGEAVRKQNEINADEKKQQSEAKMNDTRTAADVRLEMSRTQIDEKKAQSESMSSDERNNTSAAMAEINEKKQQAELLQVKKENEAAEDRYQVRKELFNVNNGSTPTDRPTPGSENIPDGVTEKSYKLNNQIITERTVKENGKVNVYLKSVSKTGIYYFKNGKPITKQMWIQETLETAE
jgi:hypothetical protein